MESGGAIRWRARAVSAAERTLNDGWTGYSMNESELIEKLAAQTDAINNLAEQVAALAETCFVLIDLMAPDEEQEEAVVPPTFG